MRELSTVTALLRIGSPRAPGPAPTYTKPHILVVLIIIGDNGAIGRTGLAREAGLGEGAVRTVLKHLKAEGYVTIKPTGCELTGKGKGAYSELKKRMPEVVRLSKTSLTVGEDQVAVLVKLKSDAFKSGIEQRDAAIKAGAAGATTYVIKNSKFQVPGSSSDCERDFPSDAWPKLREKLRPENGDIVIVCGSKDEHTSFIGAVSAALTLLG